MAVMHSAERVASDETPETGALYCRLLLGYPTTHSKTQQLHRPFSPALTPLQAAVHGLALALVEAWHDGQAPAAALSTQPWLGCLHPQMPHLHAEAAPTAWSAVPATTHSWG